LEFIAEKEKLIAREWKKCRSIILIGEPPFSSAVADLKQLIQKDPTSPPILYLEKGFASFQKNYPSLCTSSSSSKLTSNGSDPNLLIQLDEITSPNSQPTLPSSPLMLEDLLLSFLL